MSGYQWTQDMINKYPQPGDEPRERLAHVNSMFGDDNDVTPAGWAIQASSNLYGQGVKTGLTWGDLRALEREMELAETAAANKERASILNYLRHMTYVYENGDSGHGVGVAIAHVVRDLVAKINTFEDRQI